MKRCNQSVLMSHNANDFGETDASNSVNRKRKSSELDFTALLDSSKLPNIYALLCLSW